jgi:hypothetical protein
MGKTDIAKKNGPILEPIMRSIHGKVGKKMPI